MEIKTNRDELLNCLERVKDAASSSSINPILSNVLIKTKDKVLTMIATDHEIQMESYCQLTGGDEAERILPATKLQSVLRALDSDAAISVKFKQDDAVLSAGRSKFKLVTQKTDMFSLLGETSEMDKVDVLPAKNLRDALRKVVYAAAQRSHRMHLNGVLFERVAEGLQLVATDGHRLATQLVPKGGGDKRKETQHILPRKTVDILVQRLGEEEEQVTIAANDRAVKFKTEDFELISNVIDENYPDYRGVIPRKNDKIAVIERKSLAAAMRRVMALSERGSTVTLKFSQNRLDVECLNKDDDSLNDWLDINYDKEELKIGFNIHFILDVLNALEEDMVELAMLNSNSSAVIHGVGNETFEYVLMPVRL